MFKDKFRLDLKKEYNILKILYHNETTKTYIYKALERNTQREVIIKSIYYDDIEIKKNIEMEVRCMINGEKFCAYIPTIYDYFIDEKNKFIIIIMQYIEGELLRNIMDKQRNQLNMFNNINNNIILMKKICKVISEIHKVPNLVHRDLKPENIIVKNPFSKNQEVYIIDFGISGILGYKKIGTLSYMAPEQISGFKRIYVCQATDVFSLGLIGFELFTGKLPVIYKDLAYTINKNNWEEIPLVSQHNNSLPQELNMILTKALAYEPVDRYTNGREMYNAFSKVLNIKKRF